jgi:hypothetical protein
MVWNHNTRWCGAITGNHTYLTPGPSTPHELRVKHGISECIPSLSYTQLNSEYIQLYSEYTQLSSEYTQLNSEYTQQLGVHQVELKVHSFKLGIHSGFLLRYTQVKCRVEGAGSSLPILFPYLPLTCTHSIPGNASSGPQFRSKLDSQT